MTSKTFPLRLPQSMRDAVARLAAEDGVSMNQFIAVAVAEKVSALTTMEYFKQRADHADFEAFDRIMNRKGGEPPADHDRLPEAYVEEERGEYWSADGKKSRES